MKRPSLVMLTSSLLIGGVLMLLLLSQMSWRSYASYNCQEGMSTAKTEGCAIMEYGYPLRWVSSDVSVGEQNVVFATTTFDVSHAIGNWGMLSVASLGVLILIQSIIQPKKNTPAKKRK